MTYKQLADELHTPIEDLSAWLGEDNTPFYLVAAHKPGFLPGELSEDGERVIRELHLRRTHPEIQARIDNLTKTILDQRKEISHLQEQVESLAINY